MWIIHRPLQIGVQQGVIYSEVIALARETVTMHHRAIFPTGPVVRFSLSFDKIVI